MVMVTALIARHKRLAVCISLSLIAQNAVAKSELQPFISLDETYTDNVSASNLNKESSYVTSLGAGLNFGYEAPGAELNVSGQSNYVWYTHDHDLDNDYQSLNSDGRLRLFNDGPWLFGTASIDNVSRNRADNELADLITGDTTEVKRYTAGFEHTIANLVQQSVFRVEFFSTNSEDNIDEREGYSTSVNSTNSLTNRHLLWNIRGYYGDQESRDASARNYSVDATLGLITGWDVNPIVRYFDEDSSGSLSSGSGTALQSWGAGFRALLSRHLSTDITYNWVDDEEVSDDYVAATINWNPSERMQLNASYTSRFYGDAYTLNLSHRSKRLTNTISYNESLDAFDRLSFRSELQGTYWCPDSEDIVLSECLLNEGQNLDDYVLINFYRNELVESEEFVLTKSLSWQSEFKFPRSKLGLNTTAYERESLTTLVVDENITGRLFATHDLTRNVSATLAFDYNDTLYDRDQLVRYQQDYYRQYSLNISRTMPQNLFGELYLRYLNRSSTRIDRNYDESRIGFTIRKEF